MSLKINVLQNKIKKSLVETKKVITFANGKMAEWSNAAVLKTVDLHGSGGSNPSLSAKIDKNQRFAEKRPEKRPKLLISGRFYFCFLQAIIYRTKTKIITITYIINL